MALITDDVGPGVRLVGFNRPERSNALDEAMVEEIDRVLADAAKRAPAILIFHSTTPGTFVAGADIAELIERGADAALRGINAGLFERIEAHRWPTVAVVDGPAFGGGCELALACDFRVGTPNARFAQPELNLGILAGAGGNWRLTQVVGQQLARRMLYTGEIVDAKAAVAVGLVDSLHTSDAALRAAMELADTIGRRSWRALELTKLSMRVHRTATTTFDIAAQALLFESDDKLTRMRSFLDRKKS